MHTETAAVTAAPSPVPSRPWWRPFATKRFLFLSVALHLCLAGGATVWIVQSSRPARHERAFTAQRSAGAEVATHALEHQVKMAQHQNTMSAPPALRRITTLSPTKAALPAMPTLTTPSTVAPLAMAGSGTMQGQGFGFGTGGLSNGGSGSGVPITNFIGGMRVTAGKLGVALDVSGSVRDYQQLMHDYVAKVFKGSQVIEFSTAGFVTVKSARGSMGSAVLEFLNSPQKFDAIYIFSDFGETRDGLREGAQDLWSEVQKLVREKKVKLYLHVLREPGREGNINPILNGVIQFARGTGGGVKIGAMTRISEGNTAGNANGSSRL